MMPVIMLVLFALPSFGISTLVSRVAMGVESTSGSSHTQTEELEERLPCSTNRREQVQRVVSDTVWPLLRWTGVQKNWRFLACLRVIEGHRLSNGFMAPIRC